jgi:hypothetical protein
VELMLELTDSLLGDLRIGCFCGIGLPLIGCTFAQALGRQKLSE